jgi:hypothetical protein
MSHHPPSPSNQAKIAWAVGALFLLQTLGVAAQCPHNPTVTLWTQGLRTRTQRLIVPIR